MVIVKNIVLFFFLLLLASCGDLTVDGSSVKDMERSLKNIEKSLPEKDRKKFRIAVDTLSYVPHSLDEQLEHARNGGLSPVETKLQALKGKTANEIIQEAISILQEREKKYNASLTTRPHNTALKPRTENSGNTP